VNDDTSLDGTTGVRSQFNPTVAVDQTTGTVVTAWLDARDDAANARTATYVSASIDGGGTWSQNVFLNRKHTAISDYDQSTLIYGPVPDNQSTGNTARDLRFNFGDRIGLVVSNGRVTASWAGNENVTPLGTPVDCCTTEATVAHANIASGPRVISSTMGWTDPASFFDVTFDRQVDPGTFTPADVRVWRRDVYGNDLQLGVNTVAIMACSPASCTFRVSFDPQTEIGTYRYAVGPDISDRIRSVSPSQLGNRMDQNANGSENETGPATSPPLFDSATQSTHDVYLAPRSFDNTDTMPLHVTGPRVAPVTSAQRMGIEYTAIDPSTTLGLALIDGGVITNSPGFTLTDGAATPDLDTIIVPGSFTVSDLNVRLNITHPRVDDLDIVLRHVPTNKAITLVADVPFSGANFTNTTLDDESPASIQSATSSAPFTGSFRPRNSLSAFDGVNAQGQWRLEITDDTANGITGTLNSWTLDFGLESKFTIGENVPITDLDAFVDISGSDLSGLRVELTRDDNLLTIDYDPTTIVLFDAGDASGTTMSRTVFSDEAGAGVAPGGSPYRSTFRPDGLLSLFDDPGTPYSQSATNGTWKLRITDTTANGSTGTLNNWGIIINPAQTADRLGLHGAANFMDFRFDRDMDPSTFTTVDVHRIIGPAGQIGANPLGPFRYSPLDTTPSPVPIPDNSQVNSTINVPDSFVIGDVDVLVDIIHPRIEQLHLFLRGPDGTRIDLADNFNAGANLVTTILDDEAGQNISAGTAPYAGRFRPTQSNGLSLFDGSSSRGTWTLEVHDEAAGNTGSLVRWNLVLTRDPARYASTLPAPLPIPDNGSIVNNSITVAESYPIHDLEVTLNITHPQVQDLEVTLIGPDGTRVPLVANLPASSANLIGTVLDDEAVYIISAGEANAIRCTNLNASALVNPNPSCSTSFRPVLQRLATDRVTQLSDFDGLDSRGMWTLEIRDRTSGNSTGTQQLDGWELAITPSDLRVLPNPDGTDADANFPRTYRVYFPRQILSGTYAVSIAPNILSEAQSADARCFPTGVIQDRSVCGLDSNRNAGLEALRRGDGFPNQNVAGLDLRPGGLNTAVDFQSTYESVDVGDALTGRPIPEPIGGAVRPITSRIFIPDNVTISDINLRLTITHQQAPGERPLMRDDDYDVYLISPNGTRLELFSDVGGVGINFVDLFLNDEALRCTPGCQAIYIQDGSAPFSDDFRPELLKPPGAGLPEGPNGLKIFDGEQARGVWTLEIIDDTANGMTAALRSWSLEVSGRTTGLGEYASDQISSSFRLFVMDPSDPRSSTAWTAVGAAALGVNGDTSRSGGIAVDPSDPSGNTVFFAGATSGVWKTTNFLTTSGQGPTWVPLTDFAPSDGLHIGSIAVFPRNNDPKQTIVYVATGESDAGFIGVGVLKSEDGGATWRLQDSLNNDPNIPFALRDHALSRTTSAFKIIVDPTFPEGRVAYMAMSGPGGGLYKTVNGGQNWVLTRAGQATDVVLDPVNTEVLYAAFRGEGVFISSNRGAQWLLTAAATNNNQMRDTDPFGNAVTIPIGAARASPNGPKGRISLAKPHLTGDPVFDREFQGRLFAVVSTPNSLLDGVYVTSDFGANWTQLKLGKVDDPLLPCEPPVPTNDETTPLDIDPFTTLGCVQGQGNYDQAIAVDPQNPNRVYVFGAADVPVIAIDVALTYDGHNYTIFDHDNPDGGLTQLDTVGGALRKANRDLGNNPPFCEPFACINGALDQGTLSRAGLFQGLFNNIASFANSGFETRWAPLGIPAHVDYHDVDILIDPLTGKTRILVGTDGGIYSALVENGYDINGDPVLGRLASPSIGTSTGPANGSRNGNLQMTQIYGGATHPSQLAAEIAFIRNGGNAGLFYNATQDNGSNHSDPFILQNGNLVYSGYGVSGDSGAGLTTTLDDNDANMHNVFIFEWACCMPTGQEAGVIRRNRVPAVTGLDQENLDLQFGGPSNDLAINARDGNQLLYSAPSGRLYKTDDGGRQWLAIGVPAVFNNLQATAMAYGAEQPDPNPTDFIEPDEVIYIGLPSGRVLSSLTEGGSGQEWFDISAGLNGAAIQDIAANIRQFHYDVYLVTSTGVFFMPNAKAAIDEVRASGVPGGNVNNPWIDITGNLRSITHTVFQDAWNGEGTLGPIIDILPLRFSSIKVDDRYDIPDADGVRHPLVYVAAGDSPGGGGGSGVYRTFDNGGSWRRFPDREIDGSAVNGGYLPNVGITEIELALGPIDPETGLSDFTESLDLLVAHTYGRGTFAIRSAPLIFAPEGGLLLNAPDLLNADDSIPPVPPFPPSMNYSRDNITNNDGSAADPLRFVGLTHRGATVRLLEDVNGALTEVGRGFADFFTGDWTVAVGDIDGDGTPDPDGRVFECGQHVIRAQATSASGTVGQVSDPITITVLNELPTEFAAPVLFAADNTGLTTDNITRITNPRFTGSTFCGVSGQAVPQAIIRLMVRDPNAPLGSPDTVIDPNDPNPMTNRYRTVGLGTSAADGSWTVQVDPVNFPPVLVDGSYVFAVRAEDLAGNIGPVSPTTNIVIDTQVTPAPVITSIEDDTCAPISTAPPCTYGNQTDLLTADNTLRLNGTSEPNSTITVRQGMTILSSTVPATTGTWTFDVPGTLADGPHTFTVSATDIAGNTSPFSAPVTVVVDTTTPAPSALDLVDASDLGAFNNDNITSDDTPTFTGRAEVAAQVQIFVDGAPLGAPVIVGDDASDGILMNGLGQWTFTSPPLTCAAELGCVRTFSAVATDLAGNVSALSASLMVTIDTVAPSNPPSPPDMTDATDSANTCPPPASTNSNADNYTKNRMPTFVGTAEANSVVTIFDIFNGNPAVPLGTAAANVLGDWSFTPSANLAVGQHVIFARTTDLAGNNGPSSDVLFITIDITIATPSAPNLDALSDTGISNTDNITSALVLTFTGTSEAAPGNGCVDVTATRTAPTPGAPVSLGQALVDSAGNWSLTTSVLASAIDGTYSIRISVATDDAGNTSVPSAAMAPNLVIDRTAPSAPSKPDLTTASDRGTFNNDDNTNVNTPTFTGTALAGTRVEVFRNCSTVPISLGSPVNTVGTTWTFTSPTLPDGTYEICARAYDPAGNPSALSAILFPLTIDTVINQPLPPDLHPLSDLGRFDSDNITSDNTPTFTGGPNSADPNTTLTVLANGNPIGTTQVQLDGSWMFTVPTLSSLADGIYSITVKVADLAGNEAFSTAMSPSLVIDTLIAAPSITGITEDRGPNPSDRITSDTTLVFRGIAEPGTTITLSQTGVGALQPCPIGSPDVVADGLGNWSFDNTCRTLDDGGFTFRATAMDLAGNSATSIDFNVTIDTTRPGSPAGTILAPTLALVDDTGISGDGITRVNRPRLTGTVGGTGAGNLLLEILNASDTVVGSTRTAGDGTYSVQFASNLVDGSHTVRVRATDDAGNSAVSPTFTFMVDTQAPNVISFNPTGTLTVTTSQLVLQFNDDTLNQTIAGHPNFAASVRNPSNYRLTSTTLGLFDLSTSDFQYDPGTDRLVINLRDSSVNLQNLPNGNWQFRINGTTSLQDVAGNRLDGENPGSRPGQTTPLPSGNDIEGGDFNTTFTINVPPPGVSDIHLTSTNKAITKIIVSFSRPLQRLGAESNSAYQVIDPGSDGIFDTNDDRVLRRGLPKCNPLPAACTTVTIGALQGGSLNRFLMLTIDRNIVVDTGGNPLDPGSARHFIGRGRSFAPYTDSNGDRVTLSLDSGRRGRALMDVIRYGNGEGRAIHIERTVATQSARAGNSLVGSVTPVGDGVTHFDVVTGTNGLNLNQFPRPPFIVPASQISAVVVDRLLDSGSTASDLLADSVASVLSPRKKRRS
jgi:subtilisin-like proprotein convertase family protein